MRKSYREENGEKVFRYSIRKYHFGAASVAVAALMFFANGAVKADPLPVSPATANTGVTKLTEGVPPKGNPTEKPKEEVEGDKTPVTQKLVDKSPLVQAISELQAAIAKADGESLLSLSNQLSQLTDENNRLLNGENVSEEAIASQVSRVQSLTEQVRQLKSKTEDKASNKEDRTDSKAQDKKELKVSDKAENPTNQNEENKSVQKDDNKGEGTANKDKLEALSKSLITYLDTAKKIERPETKKLLEGVEEIVRSVENGLVNPQLTASEIEELMKQGKQAERKLALAVTREHSGSRDPRNGQRISQGTGERAAAVSQNWTSEKNILSYQRFRVSDTNGNLQNADRQFTESKVDMTARFETTGGSKYVVYDVFFNNNGRMIGGSTHQVIYKLILQPEILDLNSDGTYKGDTLRDLKFEIYHKNRDNGTLSQTPGNFSKTGTANFDFLNDHEKTKEGLTYYYNLDIRHNGSYGLDMRDTFKSNKNDPFLEMAVSRNGVYNNYSYGIGVMTLNDRDAVHMQVKAKLKSDVTEEKVKEAYTLAVAVTQRPTTNQSYVFVSGRNARENYTNVPDRPVVPTVKQSEEYPIKGKEVTTTVGNSLGDVRDPVSSGFVVRNDDSINFPNEMSWSWTNGQPNTSTAGIFKYDVTAHYYDNSSNSTKVTLKVKPKTPVINQNSVNEKAGKTGQNVVVTVQDGVPTGSTVTLYNGTTVIGTGTTSGQTATINVSGALPSTGITARTSVQNSNGTVESDLSAPATPTEVPDRVAPTVSINGKALTTNADDNRFIIYREANFNPTFRVQDDKNNVTLSITNLPKGVGNVSTSGSKDLSYTIPDNTVATDAPFGESTATVTATDGRNSATYKFKYRIVDIQAKNSTTENRAVGSALGDPHDHFKVAESNTAENDKYYPTGMQFKWTELNLSTITTTDVPNNTKLNEIGTITKYYATAVFPTNTVNTKPIDGVNYTIYTPAQKPVQMTFNVTDTVAPTVKMTNPTNNAESVLGSDENNLPVVEVFRGATLTIPLKMFDNNTNGKINIKHVSGLPTGVNLNNGNTLSQNSGSETNPTTATITGTVASNATLGTNVVTLKVSDDATGNVDGGNQATLKFKVKTYDLAFEDRGTPVDDNTRSDVLRLNETSVDPNYYLTTTDGTNRGDGNFGSDMKFRYLKGNNEIRETVSFDKIGKHSVKARAYFPNSKTSTKGLPTNPSGLTGDAASVNGRGFLEKTIEFNVKPNAPTIAQPQFYGTASSRPTVTVGNLPTNAQLQNGSTVTVELYQGNNKVASKTVTDGNGTTTLSAENFTANLTEGQQVHAVVKVSGGQGTTAYSVNSDNSDSRDVTGRSRLSNLASNKLVVQVQDLTNNRGGTLSEAEKNTIKTAIFEANKNGVLRGKQASDITISDTGLITALDKDNKVAELQINPNTGVVTRFAHIRDDYNITFTNNGKPANRSTDLGFEWSGDGKSLIYKFDATSGVGLDVNEVLKTITATPKNSQGQPSLTTVTGNDKTLGETNSNGFTRNTTSGYFSKNGAGVNVLDLVNPTSYAGGGNIDNTTNKLVDKNRTGLNSSNVGTTLGNDSISAANGANAISLSNVVKKANGTDSLVVRKQLYLMPKYTTNELLADRGNTNANNTNVINVYFVPVDPTAPQVERSTSNTLATTSAQASRLADNTSFASLAKVTDNYDKDDVTNPSSNTVRNKLNMWVKKGDTKVQIVENGVEKTAVINSLKKELDPATYEVIAKTSDASGNKSHADNSDGESLGFFRVGYNLVARQTINVVRGETLTQAELNKLVQVQEGNTLQDLPQGATVTATLDTNSIRSGSEETKTVEATVNFGENRTKKVSLTYKVLNTFPIANTIYDFKDVARGSNQWDYYSNTGNNIPGGMSWIFKPNGGVEKDASGFKAALASDPVGTTTYTFGGRYNYGRFTNPNTTTGNLEHTATLVHKVFDIADSKNVSVSQGTTLSAEQAKAAVKNATGSDTLPNGTTYEWVGNKVASTSGKQTFQVKVTLPVSQTGDNLPAATQATPSKTINVTVSVTPPKPTFDSNKVTSTSRTITGTLGGLNANSSNTVVSVALNDGTNRVLTSENNGGVRINGNTWTATLPDDVKLRTSVAKNGETTQPRGLTVTTKIKGSTTADDISVTSDVKAVEMGDYSVNATIAGSKHIDVKVPHDAKRMELRFHNSTETSNTPKSIVLVRGADGTWHTDATRANNTAVANANGYVGRISSTVSTTNPAENNIRIELNEQSGSTKLHIKEESANGDNTESYGSGLGLRVYNQPEAGQEPSATGKWKVANVTNNKPTLSYKGPEASSETARKVFPSETSITKAMLENLVTVGDTEDKATNETDKPYGTPTVKIVSGLTETPGKATPAGRYTVVLKAVDSQGKESDPLTVYVGVVSTELKYQPQVNGENLGEAKNIPVSEGTHHQGEEVSYTPDSEIRGRDGKVYVPTTTGPQSVHLTDQPQTITVTYVEKPATATPTFTVGTQDPQTGNVEVTVDGVPEGTKVKLPGIASEKVVTGGKVELTHNELTENPTTGKGIAQEDGKLPKEGTSDITIPGKLTSAKGEPAREFEVTIPLPIVVPDPEHLTPKEVEKLVDKVKESNPNTIVTADDKGNVTVTDKTTGESVLIPAKDLTVKDFEPVKPTDKVPVKDKAHLTPEEKKQVADKVKDKNPGKEVTVGDDGTATVTDPTTGISHTIPGTDLVTQDFEPVKPTEKVPVKDTAHLTPEEKKQVPATQPTEQPSQTVEVPAQLPNEVSEPDSSVSQPQAVLPNTGTQEDRATGALGVLSLLGAFGLLFAKKKKDDEEEA